MLRSLLRRICPSHPRLSSPSLSPLDDKALHFAVDSSRSTADSPISQRGARGRDRSSCFMYENEITLRHRAPACPLARRSESSPQRPAQQVRCTKERMIAARYRAFDRNFADYPAVVVLGLEMSETRLREGKFFFF